MAVLFHEEKWLGYSTEDQDIAQRLPHEFEEKIISFQRMMIRMRRENNYEIQCIGNMDETPMNFDMPPSRTVNPVGEKTVLI